MALSEFFPYGAPELLDGAPSRMARSTMMASLAVALLVAVVGAMMPRTVTIAIAPPYEPGPEWIDTNVLRPEPNKGAVPPVRAARDPHATPILRPDDTPVTKWEDLDRFEPAGPAGEHFDGQPIARPSSGSIAPIRDPEPGEYVAFDEFPALIRCADTQYPDLARSAGVEGTVRVLMLVGLGGKVERAIVAPKGSIPMLDQAALDAALTCVFTPALANGHPVKVWVSQNYRFSLHSAR